MKAFFVVVIPIVIGIIGLAFNWWSFADTKPGEMLDQTKEQTRLLQELVSIQRELMDLSRDNLDLVRAIQDLEDRVAGLEAGSERSATESELGDLRQKEEANRKQLEDLRKKIADLEEELRKAGYTKPLPTLPVDDSPTARPRHDTAEPTTKPASTPRPRPTEIDTPWPTDVIPTPELPTPIPPATALPPPTREAPTAYPGPSLVPPDDGDIVPEPTASLPGIAITDANAGRLQTWQQLYSTGFVESVAFGRSSRDLAWSGAGGYWRYDLQDMREVRHVSPYTGQVHSVSLVPGLGLVSGGVDASGAVVDAWTDDGRNLWHIKVADAPWGAGAVVDANGDLLVTSAAGESRVWRIDGGAPQLVGRIDAWSGPAFLTDGGIVTWLDGPRIHHADGILRAFAPGRSAAGYGPGMSVSPDGTLVAGGDASGAAPLWSSDDLTLVRTLHGHTDFIQATTFSPDGSVLATSSQDRTVRVWRVRDGEPLAVLDGFGARAQSLAFSPDGAILAAGALDGQIRLWSIGD